MKKIFLFLIITLFISCNSNPGDVYVGEWTNNGSTIKIISNGSNYLVTFTHGSDSRQSSAVCENGILKFDDGSYPLTYVQDGGYIQSQLGKFIKK